MKLMTGNPCAKSILWAAAVVLVSLLGSVHTAAAQVSQETLDSLSAPDKIETSIGTLGSRTAHRAPTPPARFMTRSTSPAPSTSITTASAAPRRWR
jgi:hypothetical protein